MEHPLPLAGDLILCKAQGGSKTNLSGQRVLRPSQRPRFSHVAVVVSGSYIVQSTPDRGVHYVGLFEFLTQSEYSSNWTVFRNSGLQERAAVNFQSTLSRLSTIAAYFLRQKYHYGINVPRLLLPHSTRKRSFCSQLAQQIYADLEVDTGVRAIDAAQVLPVDFQLACQSSGLWSDVTQIYQTEINQLPHSVDDLKKILRHEQLIYSLLEKQALLDLRMTERLKTMIETTEVLDAFQQTVRSAISHLSGGTDVFRQETASSDLSERGRRHLEESGSRNWEINELVSSPRRKSKTRRKRDDG